MHLCYNSLFEGVIIYRESIYGCWFTVPALQKTVRDVLKDHNSHIRDLLYTVMTSRPLVIVQSYTNSQTDNKTDALSRFLALFIPHQHQYVTCSGIRLKSNKTNQIQYFSLSFLAMVK